MYYKNKWYIYATWQSKFEFYEDVLCLVLDSVLIKIVMEEGRYCKRKKRRWSQQYRGLCWLWWHWKKSNQCRGVDNEGWFWLWHKTSLWEIACVHLYKLTILSLNLPSNEVPFHFLSCNQTLSRPLHTNISPKLQP